MMSPDLPRLVSFWIGLLPVRRGNLLTDGKLFAHGSNRLVNASDLFGALPGLRPRQLISPNGLISAVERINTTGRYSQSRSSATA